MSRKSRRQQKEVPGPESRVPGPGSRVPGLPFRLPPSAFCLLILVLSGLLAFGFSRGTPMGANPDESAHLQYVRVLATEGRLPALDLSKPRDRDRDLNYEAHQPPLYYVLAVPFFQAGRALGGGTGAGHACRLLSILIGLAGTALVWLLAREIVPGRPALWIAAAGIAAFLPMRLAVMASVSNDALAEATCTLALLLMVRAARHSWDARRAVALGLAVVLALLTKQSAILLLPPALLAVFLASRRQAPTPEQGVRRFFVTGAVVAAVVLAFAGWWFARNHVLYGDPLGQRAFNWYFSDTFKWEDFRAGGYAYGDYLRKKVLRTGFATFWGAFGHLSENRPDLFLGAYGEGPPGRLWGYPPRSWVYAIMLWVVSASVLGGVVHVVRRRLAPSADDGGMQASVVGIPVLHAVFVFAAFFNFNATYFQAQGRYLFPAIAILATGLAGGLLEWTRLLRGVERGDGKGEGGEGRGERAEGRRQKAEGRFAAGEWVLTALTVAGMLILAMYALFGVVFPGFRTA